MTSTERVRAWRLRNPEHYLEQQRKYAKKRRETKRMAVRESWKKWYNANKEREYKRVCKWKKEHPENVKEHSRKSHIKRKIREYYRWDMELGKPWGYSGS